MGFLRYRLNLKIFASFLLIISITCLGFLFLGTQAVRRTVERDVARRLSDSLNAYQQEIRIIEEKCLRTAMELAQEEEIRVLFLSKETEELERRLAAFLSIEQLDILELEDSAGRVFLRVHQPRVSGDIKTDQSIIREGLEGRAGVGYETGQSGLAIRAVAPIRSRNETVGLIMAGILFSSKLGDLIKTLTGLENGIYRGAEKVISTYQGFDRLTPEELEKLEGGETIFSNKALLNGEKAYLMTKPLLSRDGRFWGALSLAAFQQEESRYLQYAWSILAMMMGSGFLLSLVIYSWLARNINRSLDRIIQGIKGFSLERPGTRIELSTRDEFQTIAESFNQMADNLARYHRRILKLQEDMIASAKLATAGQMAAGIAHEIRNPLSSIQMMAQIVGSRYLQSRGQREIGTILAEIERINRLVKELLEFARPTPMRFAALDLEGLLQELLVLVAYNLEHQGIRVERRYDPRLQSVVVDGEKLRIAALNIILNAIQAMPDGGLLRVATHRSRGDRFLVQFCNTGPQIPPEDRERIFEPFFTTKKEGAGLGLALSRLVVERHFGRIRLQSNPRRTCFSLFLPVEPVEGG